MALLERLRPILAWRLDRYVRYGPSTRDNKRKRRNILDRNRISDIRHSYQILSEGFLFRRGEVLLALRLVFFRGSGSVCSRARGFPWTLPTLLETCCSKPQRGIAEVLLHAINGTIDSMTKTTIFSRCNLNSCGKMAEQ